MEIKTNIYKFKTVCIDLSLWDCISQILLQALDDNKRLLLELTTHMIGFEPEQEKNLFRPKTNNLVLTLEIF